MIGQRIILPAETIRHAAKVHAGNRGRMACALGISVNTLRRLMGEYDLHGYADDAAASARRPGPRYALTAEAQADERELLLVTLGEHSPRDAAAQLGMSLATIYRRIAEYELTL